MTLAKPGQAKSVETMVLEIRIIGPDADSVRTALLEIQAAMGSGLASNVRPSKIMAGNYLAYITVETPRSKARTPRESE